MLRSPYVIFVLAFFGLWLFAWIGFVFRKKHGLDAELREDFGTILAAALTLLGLLIGFSFSMATNRYDQRKNYEDAEANAIAKNMSGWTCSQPPMCKQCEGCFGNTRTCELRSIKPRTTGS
jgi:hypothetical protein